MNRSHLNPRDVPEILSVDGKAQSGRSKETSNYLDEVIFLRLPKVKRSQGSRRPAFMN
jgi:hypothetical protein